MRFTVLPNLKLGKIAKAKLGIVVQVLIYSKVLKEQIVLRHVPNNPLNGVLIFMNIVAIN